MSLFALTVFACLSMATAFYPSQPYHQQYYSAPGPYYSHQSSYYSSPSYYSSGYGSPYHYRSAQEPDNRSIAPLSAPAAQYKSAPAQFQSAPAQFNQYRSAPAQYRNEEPAQYSAAPASYAPCPEPAHPEIKPIVIQTQKPVPYTYGLPLTPQVLEHHAAPSVIQYYAKPWVVKHNQGAIVNAYTQKPVVVDHYGQPIVNEAPGPQAVIVEEVCPPGGEESAAAGPSFPAPGAPVYYSQQAPAHPSS